MLLLTALISWLGTGAVLHYASALGVVNAPTERDSHSKLIPDGGGLGFALAGSVIGLWVVWEEKSAVAILALALPLAVVGLVDDIRKLSARIRFGVQFVVVAILLVTLGELPEIGILNGWLLSGVVLVIGLWWINLFNFMDGIDGIAGIQAVSMLGAAAGLATLSHSGVVDSPVWFLMPCIVVAMVSFLLYNWPPARIFMGDLGSTWLAFMIFALALFSIQASWLSYFTWLVLSAVFVTDATVTLLARIARRERVHEAHRNHTYQLLTRRLIAVSEQHNVDAEVARTIAHRKVTLWVLAVNSLWLTPLAAATVFWPHWGWVVLAYLPLVVGTIFLVNLNSIRD